MRVDPDRAAPARRADRFALLALGWTVVAGVALLLLPMGTMSSSTTHSSGEVIETSTRVSLLEQEGAAVLMVFAVPALLALVALVTAHRPVRTAMGLLLLVACLLGAMSVGLFFLPAAVLVLCAAAATPGPAPGVLGRSGDLYGR